MNDILHGVRWYWDARFLREQDMEQEPLDEELIAAIDQALQARIKHE